MGVMPLSRAPEGSIPSRGVFERLARLANLFWLITQDDFGTFVGPNTAFGIFGALAGPLFLVQPLPASAVLLRLPAVILFNWSNLLVFDLANQRLPESALEDAANKPWRPVPSGLLTSDQLRRAMLVLLPLVLGLNHVLFDTGTETALLFALTWMYNDLGGGDDGWIQRNVIIAAAFGLYNLGSVKVASGGPLSGLTPDAVLWILVISAVILTTMQVQDLKDQEGDRQRGRRTAPHVLGDGAARWTIAIPVGAWSVVCTAFWGLGGCDGGRSRGEAPALSAPLMVISAYVVLLGAWVVFRCLTLRTPASDRATWQLWAFWTASLYALPCLYRYTAGVHIE
ncbi:digeranylgeranylglyceryl phosphate synthase protein [Apiospora marii]|uniref:digeranylgeranylglyceryl phosphate synthase protein n=1 Tax=Apiospora marii TaxID=335849 RepID=UPI00312E5CB7